MRVNTVYDFMPYFWILFSGLAIITKFICQNRIYTCFFISFLAAGALAFNGVKIWIQVAVMMAVFILLAVLLWILRVRNSDNIPNMQAIVVKNSDVGGENAKVSFNGRIFSATNEAGVHLYAGQIVSIIGTKNGTLICRDS